MLSSGGVGVDRSVPTVVQILLMAQVQRPLAGDVVGMGGGEGKG